MPRMVKVLERFLGESDAPRSPNLAQGGCGFWNPTLVHFTPVKAQLFQLLFVAKNPILLFLILSYIILHASYIRKQYHEQALFKEN